VYCLCFLTDFFCVEKEPRAKPDKSEVWCNIVSKSGRYHASISFDGVVTDRFGDVMGYINLDTFQVASKVGFLKNCAWQVTLWSGPRIGRIFA
jgi:hypothetical protein